MSISLELRGICRTYVKDNESFLAVDNVNLTVSPGEFLTFLGPSGCGNTVFGADHCGRLRHYSGAGQ